MQLCHLVPEPASIAAACDIACAGLFMDRSCSDHLEKMMQSAAAQKTSSIEPNLIILLS